MSEAFQYDVFVSHNSKDKPRVRELAKRLKAAGLRVWFDEWIIQPGDDIYLAIEHGLEASRTLLLCLSQAAITSDWVGLERSTVLFRDPANAGRRFVPLLLADCELPGTLRRYRYVDFREETDSAFGELLAACHTDVSPGSLIPLHGFSDVERIAFEHLFHFDEGHVSAIRLFGADDDFLTEDRVAVSYENMPLTIQPDMKRAVDEFLPGRLERLSQQGVQCFDGPNTRLIRWAASAKSGNRSALEEKWLQLVLGPIGWFDYEGLNGYFREKVKGNALASTYNYYTGLSRLLSDQDISESRLSNILDTAVTIVTCDGFIGHAARGSQVVEGKMLTTSVAENINRYWDDANAADSTLLVNDQNSVTEQTIADNRYRPRGVPHPFAAVRRGIREELSPGLLPMLSKKSLKLIGLSFDLHSAHPDLLFVAALPVSAAQVHDICRKDRGKDWFEGQVIFTPADLSDPDTKAILSDPKWLPGGHASFYRTLELIRALGRSNHGDFPTVHAILRDR